VLIIGLSVNVAISFFFDFQKLGDEFMKVRPEHIAVPFALYIIIYLIDSFRLKLVFGQFQYKIKIRDAFENSLMGYFFAYLTPMMAGSQPFQIYHLKKLRFDGKISTNIIMSRFIEYLGSAVLLTIVFLPSIFPILDKAGTPAVFLYTGLAVSVLASIAIILLFIRPDFIGNLLARLENSFIGRAITRISKKTNWGKAVQDWSQGLRTSIGFLWKEKFYIICIDIILNIVILGIQVFSLTWVLVNIAGIPLNFFQVFITVLLLNLVVHYIPTPGASGGLEGIYTMVFALYTGLAQASFIAVIVWRFGTYYLQILLGLFFFFLMRRRGVFSNKEPSTDEKLRSNR
jgi:uncharacterized protein (TIRG00374 family)